MLHMSHMSQRVGETVRISGFSIDSIVCSFCIARDRTFTLGHDNVFATWPIYIALVCPNMVHCKQSLAEHNTQKLHLNSLPKQS